MIKLDLQSRIPIYEQLKNKIVELIMLDILKANEQLPSVRTLSRDIGINPNTVQKAYQELERIGVTYSISGRGSFIEDKTNTSNILRRNMIEKFYAIVTECVPVGIEKTLLIDKINLIYNN